MASLLFVHGTGVREKGFNQTFGTIRKQVDRRLQETKLYPCFWGETHGSVLRNGSSVARGRTAVDPDIALWQRLEEDPFDELRLLANEVVPPQWPDRAEDGEELAQAVLTLPRRPAIQNLVLETPLADDFTDAVTEVLSSAATKAVLGGQPLHPATCPVIARAIVALAQRHADERFDDLVPLDEETRDELITAMVTELEGSYRGLGGLVWKAVGASQLTRPVEWFTSRVPNGRSAFAGDVMLFLARGDGIRAAIAEAIRALPAPVTVLAHSLGGVATIDLLIRDPDLPVKTIVTVGSQAPYLYELDVLPALRFGEPLPTGFPRWMNVYDPRDTLAFRAEKVFPASPSGRVTDHAVRSGVPFPRAHSAYFANKQLYQLLAST